MPASQKVNIKTLGIIAGGGQLPFQLVQSCLEQDIQPVLVGFEEHTPVALMQKHPHLWASMGQAGKIIKFFQKNNVKDLVMIGRVKRPSFSKLKPDFKAVKILSRAGFKALGDNGLLSALKEELEAEGFSLHGISDFCENLTAKEGPYGKFKPSRDEHKSIQFGVEVSQKIGALDIGQSIIVQDGIIIGVEAAEGTDELIKRCKPLLNEEKGGVLVKTCKPQQDRDLDLPTIGMSTLENAYASGLSGIAIQSGNTLVVDAENLAKAADAYKMFLIGISINQDKH